MKMLFPNDIKNVSGGLSVLSAMGAGSVVGLVLGGIIGAYQDSQITCSNICIKIGGVVGMGVGAAAGGTIIAGASVVYILGQQAFRMN